MKIELGDKVRDTLTGYAGVAIARTQWLTGCDRILVQAPVDKDGKVPNAHTVDETLLEIVEKKVVKPQEAPAVVKPGGPQDDEAALRR